jgi:hypothetical protein
MKKPVGGRGKKAPYETTHVRVPVNIKPQVEKLIQEFRDNQNQLINTADIISQFDSLDKSKEFIELMIKEFRNNNLVIVEQLPNNRDNYLYLSLQKAIDLSIALLAEDIPRKELISRLLTAIYQVKVDIDNSNN